MSKFISAKLTYIPKRCKSCVMENKDFSIIKNGTTLDEFKKLLLYIVLYSILYILKLLEVE